MAKHLQPEARAQAVELVISGKQSVMSVAAKLGVHHATVRNWVRAARSNGRSSGKAPTACRRDLREKAVTAILRGEATQAAMARELNMHPATVERWMRQVLRPGPYVRIAEFQTGPVDPRPAHQLIANLRKEVASLKAQLRLANGSRS